MGGIDDKIATFEVIFQACSILKTARVTLSFNATQSYPREFAFSPPLSSDGVIQFANQTLFLDVFVKPISIGINFGVSVINISLREI